MSPSIFVTGAAGCVGRALLERLFASGLTVIGMDLIPQPGNCPASTWVTGDVIELGECEKYLKDVGTVIHLAAMVHTTPSTHEEANGFWRVNLNGTHRIIDASVRAGVKKFLFVSTVAVLKPPTGAVSDAYNDSKRAAENLVREYSDRIEVVIARPATVYGPWDRGNMLRMIRWIDRGRPPIIGPGTNRKSMVFVRNLAAAISFLAERGENMQSYVVTDGQDKSMKEIVDSICRCLGHRNRWPAIPLWFAKGILNANDWVASNVGFPRVLSGKMTVDKLTEETVYDPSPIFTLGFCPPYNFEEGIAETVEWYTRSGR